MNWLKLVKNLNYSGAAHGEDVCYLFRYLLNDCDTDGD